MSTSDESPVIVESVANGPVNETAGSSYSDKINAEAIKKTEVASTELAGSRNVESCSDGIEMMDVSNNDAQESSVKTDEMESHITDKTVAVEDCGAKGTDPEVKTELANDELEVSKTEPPAPESKTAEAAGMIKVSLKPFTETAEEGDSKEVSETDDTKLKLTEKDGEVKCSNVEADEKEPKRKVLTTKAEITEVDIKGITVNEGKAKVGDIEAKGSVSSTQDTKTELEVTKSDSGDAEADSESGSAKVTSGEPETGLGGAKTRSVDEGTLKAESDNAEADYSAAKVDSGDEKTNLEETKVDTPDTNVDSRVAANVSTEMLHVDVDSTEIDERMETDCTEIKNEKDVDADDTKDTDKIDAISIEVKDEITDSMETETSTKLENTVGALIKKIDVESGETTWVKAEGENVEPSEGAAVSKEGEVIKSESEGTDKTESEITLHQASEKQSVNDSSVGFFSSETKNSEYVSGENKLAEISEAQPPQSTAESDTKLVTTDTSLEESNTKGSPKKARPVNEMLQGVFNFVETPSALETPTLPNLYVGTSTAKENANANEDIEPLESKNEEEKGGDESTTVEDTTKENGLTSTAENGKDDDASNNCPDSEGYDDHVKEQGVKVKKLSVDSAGNTDMEKDDDATPVAAAAIS